MAKTLYIVDDKVFTDLPKDVRTAALDETKKLLKFIPKFDVKTFQSAQFPAALDFTDAVFRLGEDSGALSGFFNTTSNQQWKNTLDSIKQHNISISSSIQGAHAPSTPDRIGVGFMKKEVIQAGTARLGITITGGMASLEDVKLEVVKWLAHGRTEADIKQFQQHELRRFPDKYPGSTQDAIDKADLKQYDFMKQPLKNWPQNVKFRANPQKPETMVNVQTKVGVFLARALVHEVRHQYAGDSHAKAALGSDAPDISDDANYGDFSVDDKGNINNKITAFELKQKNATIRIETNAQGQTFPF
jgi:hypothetical protein